MPRFAVATSALRQVEQICDRFEVDLQRGRREPLSAYLVALEEPERSAVFRELLALELQHRRGQGETPTVGDYVAQFPTKADVIEEVWAEIAGPPASAAATSCNDARELPQGMLLGHYRLGRCLGIGGMGQVYAAEDIRIAGRRVALKVLPPRWATPQAIGRFQREGAATLQLQHDHVVRCFEFGEHNGLHFLVMELVDGHNLAQQITREGQLSVLTTVRLGHAIARALDHAHRHGIVHRDIKPSNILVSRDGGLKLADLGLAKLFLSDPSDQQQPATQTGTVMGTVDYMAPEQAEDTKRADIRSDLYSLGCTLYHCLTGRPPFSGTAIQKVLAHREQQAASITSQNSAVGTAFAELIEKRLLAKGPEERFQTPAELADALKPWTQDEEPAPAAAPARWKTRARVWAAAGLAACLVVAGIVVIRLETSKAPIRIAIDEKLLQGDVRIRVDGDDIQIAGIGDTIRLRPGPHTLEIRRGDELVKTRNFQVLRDYNPVLRITLDEEKPQQPAPAHTQTTAQAPRVPFPDGRPEEVWRVKMPTKIGIESVDFSPDGKLVLAADHYDLLVWDLASKKVVTRMKGPPGIPLKPQPFHGQPIRFLLDGKHIVTAGADLTLRILDAGTLAEKKRIDCAVKPKGEPGVFIEPLPDGKRVLYQLIAKPKDTSEAGTMLVVDLETGISRRELTSIERFERDGLQVRGSFVATRIQGTVVVWNHETGKEIAQAPGAGAQARGTDLSADGQQLLKGDIHGDLSLWDVRTRTMTHSWNASPEWVGWVRFLPDGKRALSVDAIQLWGRKDRVPCSVRVWDLVAAKQLHEFKGHTDSIRCAALSPDARFVLTGGQDGTVRLWRLPK